MNKVAIVFLSLIISGSAFANGTQTTTTPDEPQKSTLPNSSNTGTSSTENCVGPNCPSTSTDTNTTSTQ